MSAAALVAPPAAAKFAEISPQAWRSGTDLAIEMYAEADMDAMSLVRKYPGGPHQGPQDNRVYRYLCKARQAGDPQIEMAFCAVLSEYVGSAAGGFCPDIEFVEKHSRRPVPQALLP